MLAASLVMAIRNGRMAIRLHARLGSEVNVTLDGPLGDVGPSGSQEDNKPDVKSELDDVNLGSHRVPRKNPAAAVVNTAPVVQREPVEAVAEKEPEDAIVDVAPTMRTKLVEAIVNLAPQVSPCRHCNDLGCTLCGHFNG
jgi:hypothetical protein